MARLETFAKKLKEGTLNNKSNEHDEIRITELSTNNQFVMSAQKIINFELFKKVFNEDGELRCFASIEDYLNEKRLNVYDSFEKYLIERNKGLVKNMILERIK